MTAERAQGYRMNCLAPRQIFCLPAISVSMALVPFLAPLAFSCFLTFSLNSRDTEDLLTPDQCFATISEEGDWISA